MRLFDLSFIITNNMNSQNIADDSMNFSIIDKNQEKMPNVDFSVGDLLENGQKLPQKQQKKPIDKYDKDEVFKKMKQLKQISINRSQFKPIARNQMNISNNFLKDLQKMQKQLSFQTVEYNIYEENACNSAEVACTNKSKTFSTLKFTKQEKSVSKNNQITYNDYYGELILDFQAVERKISDQIQSIKASSNFTNQLSSKNKKKVSKCSKSKDIQNFFRSKDRDSLKNNKLTSPQELIKRSKSKSLNSQLKTKFKSPRNCKASTQTDDFSSNVHSEYYVGNSRYNNPSNNNENLIKKKKSTLVDNIYNKSKDKVSLLKSKSKSKIQLLSPRGKKPSIKTVYSKM